MIFPCYAEKGGFLGEEPPLDRMEIQKVSGLYDDGMSGSNAERLRGDWDRLVRIIIPYHILDRVKASARCDPLRGFHGSRSESQT